MTRTPVEEASPAARLGAWMIDTLFTMGAGGCVTPIIFYIDKLINPNVCAPDSLFKEPCEIIGFPIVDPRMIVWIMVCVFCRPIYETIMIAWRGRTFGKMIVGIKVVRFNDHLKPGLTRSAVRCFQRWPAAIGVTLMILDDIGIFDALEGYPFYDYIDYVSVPFFVLTALAPITFLVVYTSFSWNKEHGQGLHDTLAGTLVVKHENRRRSNLIPDSFRSSSPGNDLDLASRSSPQDGLLVSSPPMSEGWIKLGTGESVELASITSRFIARLLDYLLLTFVLSPFLIFGAFFESFGGFEAIFVLSVVLLEITMTARRGQTFGKMVTEVKVVGADSGSNPKFTSSLKRSLLVAMAYLTILLSFLPLMILMVLLVVLFTTKSDKSRQGPHDKIADTYVIKPPIIRDRISK
ncbi:MAG: RDD family protein [Acidimicrobiaceae bacterium]|nr:RDD family protein [Acidimicrobiaceae bacterium]